MAEPAELPTLVERFDLAPLVGDDPLWRAVIEIAAPLSPGEWMLIGGQMVALHGYIAGSAPPRATTDIDIVADVLVRHDALQRCAAALEAIGLEAQPSITGKSLHRFAGERAVVDLVVPDHLPAHLDTRLQGYRTVSVTGSRRALDRAARVPVTLGDLSADIVTPDQQGAIVLKARAAIADRRDDQRHISDIAFLCSLVDDPLQLASRLDRKERTSLRRVTLPNDASSAPWIFLDPETRDNALETWQTLVASPDRRSGSD
jgi:predicted nucleotidyltransferase